MKAPKLQASSVDAYLRGLDRFSDEFLNLPTKRPLLGVPFTVKNNLDVRGRITLTGISARLSNAVATEDARVVQLLREAGAIPLAVTAVPWMSADWQTWNDINKRYTVNPYDTRRNAGGSSGGEVRLVVWNTNSVVSRLYRGITIISRVH